MFTIVRIPFSPGLNNTAPTFHHPSLRSAIPFPRLCGSAFRYSLFAFRYSRHPPLPPCLRGGPCLHGLARSCTNWRVFDTSRGWPHALR
jgi:hypothetical protein